MKLSDCKACHASDEACNRLYQKAGIHCCQGCQHKLFEADPQPCKACKRSIKSCDVQRGNITWPCCEKCDHTKPPANRLDEIEAKLDELESVLTRIEQILKERKQ